MPRMPGDKIFQGSSPLARGLRHGGVGADRGRGIIPARAGFTPSASARRKGRRDHPRSRGVYPPPPRAAAFIRGSSPLARGLPNMGRQQHVRNRIIPARAGFTADAYSQRPGSMDHPRSRGVYTAPCSVCTLSVGSSPLARGLLRDPCAEGVCPGIIPARAGFTDQLLRRATRRRGSSPLARGLHRDDNDPGVGVRIIPARAGFTAAAVVSIS